jgi:hypothetical protein
MKVGRGSTVRGGGAGCQGLQMGGRRICDGTVCTLTVVVVTEHECSDCKFHGNKHEHRQ